MTKKHTGILGLLVLSIQQAVKIKSQRARIALEREFRFHNEWIGQIVERLREIDASWHHAKQKNK